MISFFTHNLIWSQAPHLLIWCLALLSLAYIALALGIIGIVCVFFCFYFFRNPERFCPEALSDASLLVSPADGKVVAVSTNSISIFLSPLDVHVNWVPMAGTVSAINYHKGAFVPAFLPKSSLLNERNDVHIVTVCGKTIVMRQIAGTIARVIKWWVVPGQAVAQGAKYGMIMFGSRVDLLLPDQIEISVKVGERVKGGQTVIGRLL